MFPEYMSGYAFGSAPAPVLRPDAVPPSGTHYTRRYRFTLPWWGRIGIDFLGAALGGWGLGIAFGAIGIPMWIGWVGGFLIGGALTGTIWRWISRGIQRRRQKGAAAFGRRPRSEQGPRVVEGSMIELMVFPPEGGISGKKIRINDFLLGTRNIPSPWVGPFHLYKRTGPGLFHHFGPFTVEQYSSKTRTWNQIGYSPAVSAAPGAPAIVNL